MPTLERAIQIAVQAHTGQVDKAGRAYILHPLRVMFRLHTEAEQIAGVLHDVVEDSEWSLEALAAEGFESEILSALEALTKRPGESRIDAAHRAAANPLARVVKLADNAENMDLGRIPEPTEADFARLRQYEQVRAILLSAGDHGG